MGADIVRLAKYTAESGGYCTDGNREELKTLVKEQASDETHHFLPVAVYISFLHGRDISPWNRFPRPL